MLTAWTGKRNRSRLVGGSVNLIGKRSAFDYGAVADGRMRGSRVNVDFDLPELSADWQPVYHRAAKRTTRVDRNQARQAYEKERTVALVSSGGMQGKLFLTLFAVILVLIGTVLSADARDIREASARINSIERRIADVDRQREALREQYEQKAASVDVGYAAVDLGMISSKGVSMVMLYAPDNAMMAPNSTKTASSMRNANTGTAP